jgi:hypothetical protein
MDTKAFGKFHRISRRSIYAAEAQARGKRKLCEQPLFAARNQTRLPFSKVGFSTVGQGSKARQRGIN